MKGKNSNPIRVRNKRATFEYEILETYTAGIQLLGTEIKSIRNNLVSITDAHCAFINDELYILNMHIAEYENRGYMNHETRRMRKLLLTRKELDKWHRKIKERGLAMIPLSLYLNDRGLIKIDIALGRGKKQFDKRETLKKNDSKRDLDRVKKLNNTK